jgi:hypothetical protein
MSVLTLGSHRGTRLVMELSHTSMHISNMKTKKAIKYILKHPELFTEGELVYVELVKKARKETKLRKKHESCETNLSNS